MCSGDYEGDDYDEYDEYDYLANHVPYLALSVLRRASGLIASLERAAMRKKALATFAESKPPLPPEED